jgi:hypothetical protein
VTLDELKRAIDETLRVYPYKGTMPVVVQVQHYGPEVGGHKSVHIKGAGEDIDWNAGRFWIWPDVPVYIGLESIQAAGDFAHRVREIMWSLSRDPSRNRNSNAIREIRDALDEWLPNRSEKESGSKSAGEE